MFERTRGRLQLQAMKRLVRRVPRSKRANYLDELREIERKYVRSMDAAKKVQGFRNKRMRKSRALGQLVRDSEDLKARYKVDYSWEERFKSPYTLGGIGLLAAGLGLGLGLTFGLPSKEVEIYKHSLYEPSEVEVKTLDELVGRQYEVEFVDVTKGVTIDGRYRDVLNVQVEDSRGIYVFKITETDPEVFERLALYFTAVEKKGGTIEIPDPLYAMANRAVYPRTSKNGIKFGIQLDEYGNPVYCFEGDDIMFNFITHQPLEEYIKERYPGGIEFDIDF